MNLTLTLSKLASIGATIELHDESGLAIIRFDTDQVGVGRYALVDPENGQVLAGFPTRSKAEEKADDYAANKATPDTAVVENTTLFDGIRDDLFAVKHFDPTCNGWACDFITTDREKARRRVDSIRKGIWYGVEITQAKIVHPHQSLVAGFTLCGNPIIN